MKKTGILCLCAIMLVFTLAGCGKSESWEEGELVFLDQAETERYN